MRTPSSDETPRIGYGGLSLDARLSASVGFSDAMRRMQIDVTALELCVRQTLGAFAQAGGPVAELDRRECLYYCAQAMFASVVLSMGDWEALVVNSPVDMSAPGAADALDRLVEAELFRIGMFNPMDPHVVRQYKHMVFCESWAFTLEVDLLRCGQHLQASVARVGCGTQWVENGFVSVAELEEFAA